MYKVVLAVLVGVFPLYGSLSEQHCLRIYPEGGSDNRAEIRQLAINKEQSLLAALVNHRRMSYSKTGATSLAQDSTVEVWNTADYSLYGTYTTADTILAMAFGKSGRLWAITKQDHQKDSFLVFFQLFCAQGIVQRESKSFRLRNSPITALALDEDGMALGSHKKTWHYAGESDDMVQDLVSLEDKLRGMQDSDEDVNYVVTDFAFDATKKCLAVLSTKNTQEEKGSSFDVFNILTQDRVWSRKTVELFSQLLFTPDLESKILAVTPRKIVCIERCAKNSKSEGQGLFPNCRRINPFEGGVVYPGISVESGAIPALRHCFYDFSTRQFTDKHLYGLANPEAIEQCVAFRGAGNV